VGGGSAGWITALVVKKMHPNLNITLIESEDIGILGAGEGTTPQLTSLLKVLDIPLQDIIKNCDGTIKNGIKFTNWNNDGDFFHHTFIPVQDASIGYEARMSPFQLIHPLFIANLLDNKTCKDSDFMGQISEYNKVPFIYKQTNAKSLDDYYVLSEHAIHFNAFKFANRLKEIGLERDIKLIEGTVSNIVLDQNENIKTITLKNNIDINCDFVFDCTGFHRLIIGKTYNAKWKSYQDFLPCNAAVPFFVERDEEIPPYTEAIAMKYGWMWKIPLQSRFGCGYVYDSSLISESDAIAEIEEFLGYEPVYPRKDKGGFKFSAGCYEEPWIKNCIAMGLASNFLEPLEATSISATIIALRRLMGNPEWLSDNVENIRKEFNRGVVEMNNSFADFVYMHYLGDRKDTEFWQKFSYEKASDILKQKLLLWQERLPNKFDGDAYWTFESFFTVASGLNLINKNITENYLNNTDKYRDGVNNYNKFLNVQKERMKNCISHNKFLEELNEF
jgi:tryptophan halogenase